MRCGGALRRRLACVVGLSMVLAEISGCGPAWPKTYPVKGKVVLKGGGKLAAGSNIMLQSESVKGPDGSPVQADGTIQEDGSFTVATKMYGQERDGAVEGDHKVMIIENKGRLRGAMIVAPKPAKVEPRSNELTIEAEKLGGP